MPVVVLNGKSLKLPEGATAADAVQASGASEGARGVAVALDGEVLRRREWKEIPLADGAQVEVLHAVQGG